MAPHSSVLAWRIPGIGSLVGCCLWGRTESDTTEATQQQQQQRNNYIIHSHSLINQAKIPNYLFGSREYTLSTTPILPSTCISFFLFFFFKKNNKITVKYFFVTELQTLKGILSLGQWGRKVVDVRGKGKSKKYNQAEFTRTLPLIQCQERERSLNFLIFDCMGLGW